MVKDAYEASWQILETLLRYGSMNANQIFNKTKAIGGKTTLYSALDLLLKDKLISIDNKKIYTINRLKFEQDSQVLKIYDEYKNLTDNSKKLFDELGEKLKNHKTILSPTQSDIKLARELVMKKPYFGLVNDMVRIFQLGASMEFFINAGIFTKIIEKRAISLRRKNEKLFSKYLDLLKKTEPVLWGETVKLVQIRLAAKISSS